MHDIDGQRVRENGGPRLLVFALVCLAAGVCVPQSASAQAGVEDPCLLVTSTEFAAVFGARPSSTEMEFLTEEEYAERQRKNIPATEYCHYELGNLASVDAPPGKTVRFGDLQIAYDEHGRVRAAKRQFAALQAAAEEEQVLDSELSGVGDEAFLSSSNEDSPFRDVDGADAPNALTARSGNVVLFLRSHVQDVTQGDAAPGLTYSFVTVPGQQLADLAETAIGRLRNTRPAIAARFEVGRGDTDVAVGDDAVWVADNEDDEAETDDPVRVAHAGLWRLDPATEKAVGSNRRQAFGDVAVGEGAVWVTNDDADAVSRIDPATGKIVANIDVRNPEHVAVGEGAVWVTNVDAGTVARLDPATNTVADTIDVGTSTVAIAVGEAAVWVINYGDRTLARLDPATNTVTATYDVGPADDVAAGAGAVWVTSAGTLLRIDPKLVR